MNKECVEIRRIVVDAREKCARYRDGSRDDMDYISLENTCIAVALQKQGYCRQKEAMWKDNHCTNCGMTPLGEETWRNLDKTPPRFEFCMNFCPNCGARMSGCKK